MGTGDRNPFQGKVHDIERALGPWYCGLVKRLYDKYQSLGWKGDVGMDGEIDKSVP